MWLLLSLLLCTIGLAPTRKRQLWNNLYMLSNCSYFCKDLHLKWWRMWEIWTKLLFLFIFLPSSLEISEIKLGWIVIHQLIAWLIKRSCQSGFKLRKCTTKNPIMASTNVHIQHKQNTSTCLRMNLLQLLEGDEIRQCHTHFFWHVLWNPQAQPSYWYVETWTSLWYPTCQFCTTLSHLA